VRSRQVVIKLTLRTIRTCKEYSRDHRTRNFNSGATGATTLYHVTTTENTGDTNTSKYSDYFTSVLCVIYIKKVNRVGCI